MNKKSFQLNTAILLATVLLIVIAANAIKNGLKPTTVVPSVTKNTVQDKPIVPKKIGLSDIKEIFEETITEKKETPEEILKATMLQDLPLSSISQEDIETFKQASPEDTTENEITESSSPKTQPSLEDMKILKQKNLIIY